MGHPLICWDIVMEGMLRRKEFEHDIKALQKIVRLNDWELKEIALNNAVVWENKTVLVTDTKLNILHATKNIYQMNGYMPQEVLGKHPKMFQGKETTMESKKEIRAAIDRKISFNCDVINYRKDGSLYTCRIEGHPIFNKRRELVNFIALENIA